MLQDILHKVNTRVKKYKKIKAGHYLSPCRRIEKVAPLEDRYCAMTFDDGPCAMPHKGNNNFGDKELTLVLMDILNKYDAKGTFNHIGTTQYNYPDDKPAKNTKTWINNIHDHYPFFKYDEFGGIINQSWITQRLINSGHEIANHGGQHIIFGKVNLISNKRAYLGTLKNVVQDLVFFHNMLYKDLGYSAKLSKPPHYIDKINNKNTSYDAYNVMGYNYLAESYDGGGWKSSCGDYTKDVEDMVNPLVKALKDNPNALNGQIISQKDGYNMNRQSPIADALEPQLKALKENGYKVITVSELIKLSPFEDLSYKDSGFKEARALINAGYICAYPNNTFQGERYVTFGEMITMACPRDIYLSITPIKLRRKDIEYKYDDVVKIKLNNNLESHKYAYNVKYALNMGYIEMDYLNKTKLDALASYQEAKDFIRAIKVDNEYTLSDALETINQCEDSRVNIDRTSMAVAIKRALL